MGMMLRYFLFAALAAALSVGHATATTAAAAGAASADAQSQVAEAKQAFTSRCAGCHGLELEGREQQHAPPLKGSRFQSSWQGDTARGLYRRVLSTMPP